MNGDLVVQQGVASAVYLPVKEVKNKMVLGFTRYTVTTRVDAKVYILGVTTHNSATMLHPYMGQGGSPKSPPKILLTPQSW